MRTFADRLKAGAGRVWSPLRVLSTRLRAQGQRLLFSDYRLYQLWCWLTDYRGERERVENAVGYDPNYRNPQTINEKILWKKLNERYPLLIRTTDKVAVRDYVREKLGVEADALLLPILHVADDPSELPLFDCAPPYVVKTNHAWRTNLFVHERRLDGRFLVSTEVRPPSLWTRQDVIDQCNEWLSRDHGFFDLQWAYRGIERKVFIEPFIADAFEGRYMEAKLDCFHGRPTYVLALVNETTRRLQSLLDADGHRLDVKYGAPGEVSETAVETLRMGIPALVRYATCLSEDFDYCRVDFYVTPDGPRFSELTHYPHSGTRQMNPQSFDLEMGRHWHIDQ